MAEIPIGALDPRQQKLVENARAAWRRGHLDYALDATAQVLRQTPGCVAVRRFRRAVQLRQRREGSGGIFDRVASGISSAPILFGTTRRDPDELLAMADGVLEKHPNNVAALKVLAMAAQRKGWLETAAFALEAVREIEPENRTNLLELGEALLAAGRPADALRVADEVLRERPSDGEAQDLMRKASIAETVEKGRWAAEGTWREKLRDGGQDVEQARQTL